MNMRAICCLVAGLLLLATGAPARAEQARLGYVDYDEGFGLCKDYWLLPAEKKQEVLKLYQEYLPRFADSQRKIWSAQVALEFAMIDGEHDRKKLAGLADQLNGERGKLLQDRVEFRSRMHEATSVYLPLADDFMECLGLLGHGEGFKYPGEGDLPQGGETLPGMGGTPGPAPKGDAGKSKDNDVERF